MPFMSLENQSTCEKQPEHISGMTVLQINSTLVWLSTHDEK